MRGKLTKLSTTSKQHEMRTDDISGIFIAYPELDERFDIFKLEGFDEFDNVKIRTVSTSMVEKVHIFSSSLYEFWTLNSHYRLEVTDVEEVISVPRDYGSGHTPGPGEEMDS